MSSDNNRITPLWKVVVLHLLGVFFIFGGAEQGLGQVLQDGLWPVPFGIVFLLLGGYLWMLGARARLARARQLSGRRGIA